MPRGPLSPQQKQAMQEARQTTKRERDEALAALESNPQFTSPKLWKKVDAHLQDSVVAAITKAKQWAKEQRISVLQAEIDRLRSE